MAQHKALAGTISDIAGWLCARSNGIKGLRVAKRVYAGISCGHVPAKA